MVNYLCKRLLLLVPVFMAVATIVFFLIRMIPGDPVDFILGENAPIEARTHLVKMLHLDQPLTLQYTAFFNRIIHFDFGESLFYRRPVMELVRARFTPTAVLACAAMLWASVIALPLGVIAALNQNNSVDRATSALSLIGISVPTFYLGPVLGLVFSIGLGWLPLSGDEGYASLVLPSLTLGLAMASILTRMTRTAMIDVLKKEYVRTATAKGLPRHIVVIKHALRTALIPVIAVFGLQLGTLLAGAVVTEKIFSWPGLGSLLLEAINRRDYPVVQGCVILIACLYVCINLLTDLVYACVDPRVRQQQLNS